MIRLKDLPLNEEAVDDLIKNLKRVGYGTEEAQRIADESMSLAASFFKTLDDKITEVSKDEQDQLVIQSIVLKSVAETSIHIMELIEAKLMMNMISRLFR